MNEEEKVFNQFHKENYINNTKSNKAKYILSVLIKDLINIKYFLKKYLIKLLYICAILSSYSSILFRYKYNNIIRLPIETYTLTINNEIITYLRSNYIRKFNSYMNKCINKNLEEEKNYPLIINPKISAIIPLHNGEKYFKYSLCSIQNQKFKEIEIIIIDDYSQDNTLIELQKYMEKDKRIKLIKNFKNRLILYSKSMAALNSNSKYIIQLDQDDIFLRDDVFDILYDEAEKNDLDLVQIRDIFLNKFFITKSTKIDCRGMHFIFKTQTYNKSHYEIQPNLKNQMFLNGNVYLLWGLLIKTDIYKKTIYHLWTLIMNYQVIYYEDYIITSIIVTLSKKYKYLNNFGLIHLNHNNSAMVKYFDQFYIGVLFCGYNIYNYYIKNNPKNIIILINYIKRYKKIYKLSQRIYSKFFNYTILNILNNENIAYNDKQLFLEELEINYNQSSILMSYKNFMKFIDYKSIYYFQNFYINNTIKKNSNIKCKNNKISIIVYCIEFRYLEKTLNSIQNQKYNSVFDYEIILIYDNDIDNDFYLIKQSIKKYMNLKFIYNINKKGLLYSYSLGVLESKGDYILFLKSGETLSKKNILNKLYYKIINNTYDVLEFNLLLNNNNIINNNSLKLYKCQHIQSEINISVFKYNKNYKELDQEKELITNKLIKATLLKKIINKYKLNKYNNDLYIYFDELIWFLLFKENIIFIHLDIFGVVSFTNIIKLLYLNKINNNQKINDSIFYIDFLFENTKNTYKEKKFVLDEFINLLSIIYNKFNKINQYSNELLNKFLICEYISENEKKELKFYYNSLIN